MIKVETQFLINVAGNIELLIEILGKQELSEITDFIELHEQAKNYLSNGTSCDRSTKVRKKEVQDELIKFIYDNGKAKIYQYTLLYVRTMSIKECKDLMRDIKRRTEENK
tara:strand:- start:793 stop:1122 length:330 start_codon:yes stop_codon:yes gene_type:complete